MSGVGYCNGNQIPEQLAREPVCQAKAITRRFYCTTARSDAKQDERWETLEKRQYHADKAVEELQSDVASLKTVTQDRLWDDILGELEVKLKTKEILESGGRSTPLSASAPEFVSHASSGVLPGPGVGAVPHKMRPQLLGREAP